MKTAHRLLLLVLTGLLGGHPVSAKIYRLYYLGGQSNMDGYGRNAELPRELSGIQSDVMIFHGNTLPDDTTLGGQGVWAPLRPGHGVYFSSDGTDNTYSDRFGVELSFAKKLKALRPEESIAIIKYCRGGTSIAIEAARNFGCWDPDFRDKNGINQYDHFLATVRNAMSISDIDHDGETDILVPAGIIWMQGESDAAWTDSTALKYVDNLKRLMDLVRAAFRSDDLPVVIGRISDSGHATTGRVWKHGDIVRMAQHDFVSGDACAALIISTDEYDYSDPWHYNTDGYIDLGNRFAESMAFLLNQ